MRDLKENSRDVEPVSGHGESVPVEIDVTVQEALVTTVRRIVEPCERLMSAADDMNRRMSAWIAENDSAVDHFEMRAVEAHTNLQDALARTVASFAEPCQQLITTIGKVHTQFTGWVAENQDAVVKAAQLMAETRETALRIAEQMSHASLRLRELLKRTDHVAKLGWTFGSNSYFDDLAHLSELKDRTEADAYMLQWYEENDPELKNLECRLGENPRLVSFKTVLRQCFSAIRRGEYAIAIPCVMPILEQVVTQLNPPHVLASTDATRALGKSSLAAKRAEKDIFTAAVWLSLHTFIEDLYQQYPAIGMPRTASLSRKAILHGRKEPPNEKAEAVRLLHALDTALGFHEELEDTRTRDGQS